MCHRIPQLLEDSRIHRSPLRIHRSPERADSRHLTGERIPLNRLWNRRQCTKFNGTSYITQRAAEAIYTPAGKQQIKENIDYYMNNARTMKEDLKQPD